MAESSIEVAELLPHAGRAVLLDEVRAETAHGVIAAARIRQAHPFFSSEANGVPSWVGIELMAQAISLHAGLLGLRESKSPRVGYLLGARSYVPTVACFPLGAELEVRAERLYLDASGLGAYDCTILDGKQVLANATITVFQTEEEIGG